MAGDNSYSAATLSAIGGTGLFITSFLADLFGVLFDGGFGVAPSRDPALELRLGLAYVYDPTFDYRVLLTSGLALWFGRFALEPKALIALDDDNARFGASARYRFLRADRGRGSYFDARGGFLHHRYGSAGFSTNTLEIELGGRFDLSALSRTLSGAFLDGGAGVALELDRFREATEGRGLLLARFGFGLYLGRGGDD